MSTQYNTYTREVPHERENIAILRGDILNRPGVAETDLLKGRDLTAVLASLQFLLEQGEIIEKIEPGHDDRSNARKLFPSDKLLRSICS
jgi:hypothetical protein